MKVHTGSVLDMQIIIQILQLTSVSFQNLQLQLQKKKPKNN